MQQVRSESGLGPVIGLVSERFLTGGSLLLKGRIGEGLLHTALGMLAFNFFGLPGVLAVSANSFALAETGENVLQLASHSLGEHRHEPHTETTTPPSGTKRA
ncbi:MAG: hypothetical protein M3O15_04545 [Acidobacteriota bacterium]|nr:hypothetical protein [Acidobacteriota bacterium]